MTGRPSHTQDRAETRAARALERADVAEQVWGEVKERANAIDDKTTRLKAQRLARDAEEAAIKSSTKAGKKSAE